MYKYGRAIVCRTYTPILPVHTELGPIYTSTEELIGYALPINVEQSRHVMFFREGLILVTEPKENNESCVKDYKMRFEPSDHPFITSAPEREFIREVISGDPDFFSRVILRSDYPEHTQRISEEMKTAIELASQLREKRNLAKQAVIKDTARQIDALLNPPQPPPDNPSHPPLDTSPAP